MAYSKGMESYAAVFDGKVFVPEEPVDLLPNARVRVTVDPPTPNDDARRRREAFEWLKANPHNMGGADFDRGDLYP